MTALPAAESVRDKPVLLPSGAGYLRRKMAERPVTVTGLAAEIGVSRKHLSNVLNGHVPLIDPLLGRLCRALWVERSFLAALLDDGARPDPTSAYGCMKGTIVWYDDPTAPMEGWAMLED
jgi:DNA-binding Xre family transcriptional regulator